VWTHGSDKFLALATPEEALGHTTVAATYDGYARMLTDNDDNIIAIADGGNSVG